MDSIVQNLMKDVASGNNLTAISKSVGGDQTAVQKALGMGLPLVLGSMAGTASKPGGAESLTKMLSQAGGSNPMDNLAGFLGSPAASGGAGMANTLFGGQMSTIQNAISQKTGLPPAVVGQILAIATPIVMAHVGKIFTQQKMDTKGLSGLLGEQSKMAMQSSPDAAALATQFLGQQESGGGIGGLLKKVLGK